MNQCLLHRRHPRTVTDVYLPDGSEFKLEVYDAGESEYRGYCASKDVLSRQLIEGGNWEYWNTALLLERQVFQGGLVIDVGSHIGWFSVVAALKGCYVLAFDGDEENAEILCRNAVLNGLQDRIDVKSVWIDEHWDPEIPDVTIDLLKVDLEGKDSYAVEALWPHISLGRVNHMLVEVSPVFNEGYPELVERICSEGYTAEVTGPSVYDLPSYEWVKDCHQVDLLFTRLP